MSTTIEKLAQAIDEMASLLAEEDGWMTTPPTRQEYVKHIVCEIVNHTPIAVREIKVVEAWRIE